LAGALDQWQLELEHGIKKDWFAQLFDIRLFPFIFSPSSFSNFEFFKENPLGQ
jgi:hypothetical protein